MPVTAVGQLRFFRTFDLMNMAIGKLSLEGIGQDRPFVIAGPCAAENREQVLGTAEALSRIGVRFFRAGVWKPRTRPGGFEGVGSIAFEWMQEARELYGLRIATEVATPHHVEAALAAHTDLLWIGARTTASPFAVQEIAEALKGTGVQLLIKNPVSPDLSLWCGAVERFLESGLRRIGLIHRGFSWIGGSSCRNAPLWNLPIEMRRLWPDVTMVCDPSHIGGRRDLVGPLAQQALDLDFDGLLIESHIDPASALSDRGQQLTPKELELTLKSLHRREDAPMPGEVSALRGRIDALDREMIELLAARQEITDSIGRYKKSNDLPLLQSGRYREIIADRARLAREKGLDPDYVTALMETIHDESIRRQVEP